MIKINSNIDILHRDISDTARRQLPFAVSIALNDTAKTLINLNKRHMRRVFQNPTRWTLNAFHFRRSTKSKPWVRIERKYIQARKDYLLRQAEGGQRKKTGFERLLNSRLATADQVGYVVPTKHMRKNRFGNVSPGNYQKILSGLKSQGDRHQNETKRSAARKRRSSAARYFTPRAGSRLSPGIYSRAGRSAPKKIFAFTQRAPAYKKRFEFYPTMRRSADRLFPKFLNRALIRAFATRR